jgi:hypothetical protein
MAFSLFLYTRQHSAFIKFRITWFVQSVQHYFRQGNGARAAATYLSNSEMAIQERPSQDFQENKVFVPWAHKKIPVLHFCSNVNVPLS